eukprot:284681-Amphidinium_carterae.1
MQNGKQSSRESIDATLQSCYIPNSRLYNGFESQGRDQSSDSVATPMPMIRRKPDDNSSVTLYCLNDVTVVLETHYGNRSLKRDTL